MVDLTNWVSDDIYNWKESIRLCRRCLWCRWPWGIDSIQKSWQLMKEDAVNWSGWCLRIQKSFEPCFDTMAIAEIEWFREDAKLRRPENLSYLSEVQPYIYNSSRLQIWIIIINTIIYLLKIMHKISKKVSTTHVICKEDIHPAHNHVNGQVKPSGSHCGPLGLLAFYKSLNLSNSCSKESETITWQFILINVVFSFKANIQKYPYQTTIRYHAFEDRSSSQTHGGLFSKTSSSSFLLQIWTHSSPIHREVWQTHPRTCPLLPKYRCLSMLQSITSPCPSKMI